MGRERGARRRLPPHGRGPPSGHGGRGHGGRAAPPRAPQAAAALHYPGEGGRAGAQHEAPASPEEDSWESFEEGRRL